MALAKIIFHPGASEDYAAAFSWYYKRGAALAANFESEIDRSVRLVSLNPLRWAKDDALVLAVAHGKRRPYYWRETVSDQ